jgi:uncharacterized protein YndB with AHSA1/START domain
MSRNLERTFSVAMPVERVWRAMTDPEELNQWYFPFRVAADGSTRTEILGEERPAEVIEFEAPRRFCVRTTYTGREQWPPLPPGTRDITVVLEASDVGTRVVITHSGFGDGDDWEQALGATSRGVDETIADLVCYLETGVGVRRHPDMGESFHGIGGREVAAGLEVLSVQPGTFAAELGLAKGDFLVELAGGAVFGFAELNFFIREHPVGESVDAAWVRNGQIGRGTARLGARQPVAVEVT